MRVGACGVVCGTLGTVWLAVCLVVLQTTEVYAQPYSLRNSASWRSRHEIGGCPLVLS